MNWQGTNWIRHRQVENTYYVGLYVRPIVCSCMSWSAYIHDNIKPLLINSCILHDTCTSLWQQFPIWFFSEIVSENLLIFWKKHINVAISLFIFGFYSLTLSPFPWFTRLTEGIFKTPWKMGELCCTLCLDIHHLERLSWLSVGAIVKRHWILCVRKSAI